MDMTSEQVAEMLHPDPPKEIVLMALANYNEGNPKHFFERVLNLGEKRMGSNIIIWYSLIS